MELIPGSALDSEVACEDRAKATHRKYGSHVLYAKTGSLSRGCYVKKYDVQLDDERTPKNGDGVTRIKTHWGQFCGRRESNPCEYKCRYDDDKDTAIRAHLGCGEYTLNNAFGERGLGKMQTFGDGVPCELPSASGMMGVCLANSCVARDTANFTWQVGPWGAFCDTSSDTRTRLVWCTAAGGRKVKKAECAAISSKPITKRPCQGFSPIDKDHAQQTISPSCPNCQICEDDYVETPVSPAVTWASSDCPPSS